MERILKPSWLAQLNPAQTKAVTSGDGSVLVVAGAGTGKTKTLACRVAYLIEQGVEADRILLLTFTRRAAAEMLNRAGKLAGAGTSGKVWGGTFHAMANRLLRIYGQAIQLPNDFTVMDQGDAADMMNLIRTELGYVKRDRRFPRKGTLVKIYSHTVNAQKQLIDVVETHFPWCADDVEAIAGIFKEYTQRKTRHHLLDYDDLLLYWQALCAVPRIGEKIANRFLHILVDEYQDTNAVQAQILRGMRKKYNNIFVVGDDAQSIYSFRAATVRNILDFPKQFEGTEVIALEQNYRSTKPILDAANAVMRPAKERYTKELWSDRPGIQKPQLVRCVDETDQTEQVCQSIIAHLEEGVPLMEQAVLFRAGHHSVDLEIELARRNIPFHKFGGLKFIEAGHIKDVLALVRILENPYDEISWFRVLQMLDGIGPGWARRIMGAIGFQAQADATDGNGGGEGEVGQSPLARFVANRLTVPAPAKEQFDLLRCALEDCADSASDETNDVSDKKASSVAVQVERLCKFYRPLLERNYDNAPARLRDLDELERIALRFRSRSNFITDLTLDPPNSTSDLAQPPYLDEDWLTLSTIHSAKGCEWTVVHILHAADGMIPSDMAVRDEAGVEEERRLFYVAMTRAKDDLRIYFPLRYYHTRYPMGDGHGYAQLTRFIPKDIRSLFDERIGQTEEDDESPDSSTKQNGHIENVHKNLNRLWGG